MQVPSLDSRAFWPANRVIGTVQAVQTTGTAEVFVQTTVAAGVETAGGVTDGVVVEPEPPPIPPTGKEVEVPKLDAPAGELIPETPDCGLRVATCVDPLGLLLVPVFGELFLPLLPLAPLSGVLTV